ncbi:zinc ribbon-containing protein [Colwellia sp. MEBiC06753]
MAEKTQLDEVYSKLNTWLNDVKDHEITELVDIVEQAKLLVKAAENLSEERMRQFIDNFRYDLADFIDQWQQESEHSVYLGLLNETWWDTVAKAADTTQIEWAELPDDFKHQGVYHTGDYIGFGQLKCRECGELLTISHFSQVSDCTHCGHNSFTRLPL